MPSRYHDLVYLGIASGQNWSASQDQINACMD